ncbi:MAG TPA: hypothetical protein VFI28_11625 [Candidatus Limnocylindrales bacterium]|nr:hypothetical protein [Candidatus Limnocylindrales bacterium]
MDPARLVEMEYRVSHHHNDGSTSPMIEVSRHEDPAAHDPERLWGLRRIFRCTSCDETVTIEPAVGDEGGGPTER